MVFVGTFKALECVEIPANYVKDIENQMKEMTHMAQKMSNRRPIWTSM